MIASMGLAVLLFGLLVVAFIVFLFWRVFTKAGMSGPLALLVLVPGIGWVIALCILAFSEWRVQPTSALYAPGSSAYPPPGYPPANYPPSGPPAI